jgi:hypothetical protein
MPIPRKILLRFIQSVPGGEINILGGHSIGHSKKKIYVNMCPIPNGFRYSARNIFLPSHRNAPMSESCQMAIVIAHREKGKENRAPNLKYCAPYIGDCSE